MFKVGDLVKIKATDDVFRPFNGNNYRYKITKIRMFLWFRSYDLKCVNKDVNVKQVKVPERELAWWWQML